MKKSLLAVSLVIILASPLTAVDYGEGRMKLGGVVGAPMLITFGLPVGDAMELNVFLGYDFHNKYTYRNPLYNSSVSLVRIPGTDIIRSIVPENIHSNSGAFYMGGNFLFTLVDINIKGSTFPLSLGPQAGVSINGNGNRNVRLDLMADLRWEYTFSFPLNLFVELAMGAGFNFNFKPEPVEFRVSGGAGVRYVF